MTWKRIKEPFACFISEEQLGVRIIAGGRGGRSLCKKSGEQAQIALDRIWAESIGLACDGKTELLSLNLFPSQETEMELHPSNALENVIFFFLPFSATWYWSRCCSKLFANVRNTWALGSDLQKCWHSYCTWNQRQLPLNKKYLTIYSFFMNNTSGLRHTFPWQRVSVLPASLLHLQQQAWCLNVLYGYSTSQVVHFSSLLSGAGSSNFSIVLIWDLQLFHLLNAELPQWLNAKWGQRFFVKLRFEIHCSLWNNGVF